MKYIKSINEYRNQLEIPFDNKHPLHDKPNYIHVLDALEDLTIKTINKEDYKTTYTASDIENLWNNNYQAALDIFKDETDNSLYEDSTLEDYFKERLQENKVLNVLKNSITSNGLIPLWRGVVFGGYSGKDTYEVIVYLKNIGIYWTWDVTSAKAYAGSGNGTLLKLAGLVNPEYINWPQTIFKSAWHYRNENEVELIRDKEILIYSITTSNNKNIKMDKSYLIKI